MSTKKALSPKINSAGRHHAYLVLGGDLPAGEGERGARLNFPIIGINEARSLRERAQLASPGETILVCCEAITEEGQGALLKTFEEPARGIKFILFAPESIQLLPTLRSRFEIIKNSSAEVVGGPDLEPFLKATSEKRLKMVADLLKQADEHPKSAALKFLNQLEKHFAQKIDLAGNADQIIFVLDQIRQCRLYLHDKSGTPKLILEHIALILPL